MSGIKELTEKLLSPLYRQILLFCIVGTVCYFVSIFLLMIFVEVATLEVNLANLIASILTIIVCYFLNVRIIFQGGRYAIYKEIGAFFVFSLLGLAINVMLMYLMTKYLSIWYVGIKTIITLVVAVFNFTTRKWIIFKG